MNTIKPILKLALVGSAVLFNLGAAEVDEAGYVTVSSSSSNSSSSRSRPLVAIICPRR